MAPEQTKYKVLSLLLAGEQPVDVAGRDDVEVSYATVLRWSRELQTAKDNGTIAELIDLPAVMAQEIMDRVAADAPAELMAEAKDALSKIGANVLTLQNLQDDFVVTAKALSIKIKSMSMSAENISDIVLLSEALSRLQNAFFNKNMTQVNVQNNLNTQPYSEFLSDVPAK